MFRLCTLLFILQSVVGLDPGCYKKLWFENVAKAKAWTRPHYSSEFGGCKAKCEDAGTFDFVIIGAGTGGSVLANRLSENSDWTVLVLEAGEPENNFNKIPAAELYVQGSNANWGYLTTPQEHACRSRLNNQCAIHAGKIVGGSSSIDDLEFTRGNKNDFDSWAEMGLKGWGYSDVLKYFKKLENVSNIVTDCDYRGYKGPQDVTYAEPPEFLTEHVLNANHQMGFENGDYNGKNQFVTSRPQLAMRNGLRESSGCSFLMSVYEQRGNLHLKTKALASKIFIGKGKKANSVNYFHKGACHNVKARREIIVSAGVINSPKLLMLSGLGPQEHLRNLSIDCVHDLPAVGQNYRESIMFPIHFRHNLTVPKFNYDEEFRALAKGHGQFTQNRGSGLNFVNLFPWKNVDRPDIALKVEDRSEIYSSEVLRKVKNFNKLTAGLHDPKIHDLIMWIELFHTESVGEVTLNSTDPLDYPLVNPNYLSNHDDIEDLFISIMYAFQYFDTESFKDINAYVLHERFNFPACKHLKGAFKYVCVMKHIASGSSRGTGTCRMGKTATDSVVNERLIVHGFKKLRVVDGSVIPTTVSGKTSAVTAMIAEKIAEDIKHCHASK